MGCDWYDFKAACSSGYGIMVRINDVKEAREPGSSKPEVELEDEEDMMNNILSEDDLAWLAEQATGFKMYNIASCFVMLMSEDDTMLEPPTVDVRGPYESDPDTLQCNLEPLPSDNPLYSKLVDVASKLTPKGKKMSCAPGRYLFSTPSSHRLTVEELNTDKKKEAASTSMDLDSQKMASKSADYAVAAGGSLPSDFDLVVGKGDKLQSIAVNKAILYCFIPTIETLVEGDVMQASKLDLPDLDPKAVELVLKRCTSREKVEKPSRWNNRELSEAVDAVEEKFAMNGTGKPVAKKVKANDTGINATAVDSHLIWTDTRWHDATFLVGPDKEELKVNRAALASLNDVMCRILYGTGQIAVDPSKPIEWPYYDVVAVRSVFLALARSVRGNPKEVVVPIESGASVKDLLSFLMESAKTLEMYFETPFERQFENGFTLTTTKDQEGLKMDE